MTSSANTQDCEYITPPVNLRTKVRVKSDQEDGDFDPVAAAEKALQNLSGNFSNWMAEETGTLVKLWSGMRLRALTPDDRDSLFRAAHDIKGQGVTLGFPLASTIADSLCHLLETVQDPRQIPNQLIEQHVQSIRAIYADGACTDCDPVATELANQLAEISEQFISTLKRN
ncbi:Hpt domain-containing protein [Breoghania sp. L-A4]|uniref:Hpt domain-containing protein n=1 Tax=Breoghania sp. L-A4 TaxID=2304600 RepID=UPI0013C314AE|nr:Hpt domain-containing protein [Breoghania sp. L-A4]